MKSKNINIKITLIAAIFIVAGWLPAAAQKGKNIVSTEIEVVDEAGKAIPFAVVKSAQKRKIYTTDENGKIVLQVPSNDDLKVEADGYTTKVVAITSNKLTVALDKDVVFNGESSKLYTLYGETTERRTVGSWSKVSGLDMEKNPTMSFYNGLAGWLNGLYATELTPIDNRLSPEFFNGWSRADVGTMLVFVDGVERQLLDYVDFETVESVQLVKDASLKALYGGVQTSGILMIKTRRGKPYENSARVNVQTGIQQPLRLPEYLNSYEYAKMFNQARANDGLPEQYSAEEIEKYRTGSDPILYPDVDFYGMFLNKHMSITRANMQYSGGNEKTRFFAHLGYKNNGGLEKYTANPNNDRVITVRGNVDNTILNFITFQAGFNAALQNKTWYNYGPGVFMNMLSNTRPNEFPIFIPGEMVPGVPKKEYVAGDKLLGGSASRGYNPYGILVHNGSVDREYSYVQSDFALNIDLDQWIKGLSVRPMVTFDTYNYFSTTLNERYMYWVPSATNDPDKPIKYTSYGDIFRATGQSAGDATTLRNYAFNITGTYNRTFGKHDINALAMIFGQRKEASSGNAAYRWSQDLKRVNMGGTVNYMYDHRYIAELSVNRVGVSSFAPDKRFGVFPTIGAGWVISDESFMKEIEWLDYLKLRGSYGIIGSTDYSAEGIFTPDLYVDRWESPGTYGSMGGQNQRIARLSRAGNPDITFQKSYELNVGADFLLFKSLKVSAGYFNTRIDGVMATASDATPGVSGKGATLMMQNYKQYKTYGWEGEAMYTNRMDDLQYSIGFNITYAKGRVTKEAEPDYPAHLAGLRKASNFGDVKGYRCIGTFTEAEIADPNMPKQLFGEPVHTGDLKYVDTNGDGFVDEADRVVIGNATPSVQYGIIVKLNWKGFNLDLMGYGLAGFERNLSGYTYYSIYGDRKYSKVLIDGLPNGNPHPVISSIYRANNFQNSDYWMVNGSWFKLRNAELGYTLPYTLTEKVGIGGVKVFYRGFNLMTISKIKDRDPESIVAGVGLFPLCRTHVIGASITF